MSPLLVPILAQLVTLGVGDRTEARLVKTDGERTTEGSTSPIVGLNIDWRRFGIAAAYYPTFTIRPIDSDPQEIEESHGASLGLRYHQRFRRTELTISETATYTQQNLQADAVAPRPGANVPNAPNTQNPAPDTNQPGGTTNPDEPAPGTTAPNQPPPTNQGPTVARVVDRVVRLGTLTTSVRVEQFVSAVTSVGGDGSYTVFSGVDDESRQDYPLVTGQTLGAFVKHELSRRDGVDVNWTLSHAASPERVVSWLSVTSATYRYRFALRTNGYAGAGISTTLTRLPNGVDIVDIYPTFTTGIAHAARVGRGLLSLHAAANAAPVLDMTTAAVDPRVALDTGVLWTLDRLSMAANASALISLNEQVDALNSIGGTATIAYALGAGFSVDTGVRAAWQTLGGVSQVPPSWALFVGLSWGAVVPIHRNH